MPEPIITRGRVARAHLVQLNPVWESPEENFEKVRRLFHHAEAPPATGDLIVLPEMFDTGFSMHTPITTDMGSTLRFLRDFAAETDCIVQGGRTVAGAVGTKSLNVMTVVAPDGATLCEYAKIHPFSLGKEDEFFASGWSSAAADVGAALPMFQWGTLAVCPAICYDLRFPELFRIAMIRGADVFSLGACWPRTRQAHWRALLIARAIENQAFVFGVNRVGSDPDTLAGPGALYAGGSIVVSPMGEILGELDMDHPAEQVLSVAIDDEAVRQWRGKFPAWKDHRLMGEATMSTDR